MNATRIFHLFLTLSLVVGGMAITPATPVRADTHTVTDCSESIGAAGRLVDVITSADPGDTINFSCSGTINVSSAISISKNITIDGSGQAVVLSRENTGEDTRRVMTIGAGLTVVIENLTISDGYCELCFGAGILNSGNLTVTNTTFTLNSAHSGGAIYNNTDGVLNVSNSVFTNNSTHAANGGAIYNKNDSISATVTDSTFTGNTANTFGGGIFNAGTLNLTDSTLSGNHSIHNGGGIYNLDSNPTLTNVIFNANNHSDNNGGGMYNNNSSPTLTNVTFSANSADNGGGMYNNSSNPILTNVTFNGNSAFDAAPSNGGGLYNNNSSPTITDGTFFDNYAENDGGGIYNNNSNPTLTKVTFASNGADNNGGGIYNHSGNTIITGSALFDNAAGDGGGIYNNSSILEITNSTLSDNTAAFIGGGIFNLGTLRLTNNTLSDNSAGDGGGIYNDGALSYLNTIVANSISGGDCSNLGDITLNTNNLVEDGTCSAAFSGDPSLGPLADNPFSGTGGSTQTHALLPDSQAINKGDNSGCPATDQRGAVRPQGATCDIGAYEFVFPIFKSQGKNDGWILESDEFSNTGGTLNKGAKTLNLGDDADNRQYRAVLSFNTGDLPDTAAITKVTLKLRRQGVTGGGNPITLFGGFKVDIKKDAFGASSLQLTDFSYKTGVKTLKKNFKPKLSGGWYTINLTSGKAKINKTGLTQIRLRFKADNNNNSAANFLKIYSGNAGSASRPQLIVEYNTP